MFYCLLFGLLLLIGAQASYLEDLTLTVEGTFRVRCVIGLDPAPQLPNYASVSKVGVEQPIIEMHLVNVTPWEAADIGNRYSPVSGQVGLMLVKKNYGIGWCWFFSFCHVTGNKYNLHIEFGTAYEMFFIHGGNYECKWRNPQGEYKTEQLVVSCMQKIISFRTICHGNLSYF